jgi:spermidine synthase
MKKWVFSLLLLSGFSGFIHGSIWIKWLILIFGNTPLIVNLYLACILVGFSSGNLYYGRWVGANSLKKDPLKRFSLLARRLGIFALLIPILFKGIDFFYRFSSQNFDFASFVIQGIFLTLSIPLLLYPAFLFGGFLPVLSRVLVHKMKDKDLGMGKVYSMFALGMGAGTFLAGFLLIRGLGLFLTNGISALAILLIAGIALKLSRKPSLLTPSDKKKYTPEETTAFTPFSIQIIPYLLAITGFAVFGSQLIYTRFLTFFTDSSFQTYAIILTAILGMLAVGSNLMESFMERQKDSLRLLGWMTWGIGLASILFIPVLSSLFFHVIPSNRNVLSLYHWEKWLFTILPLVLPSLLLGAILALATRFVLTYAETGKSVGEVNAYFTRGGFIGILLTGSFLIPRLGYQTSLLLLVIFLFLAGLFFVSFSLKKEAQSSWKILVILSILVLSSYRFLFVEERPLSMINHPELKGESIFYREGFGGIIEIVEREGIMNLFIHGELISSTSSGGLRLHRLLALLPILFHEDPKDVLLIPFGSGITAGAVRSASVGTRIERADCVEKIQDLVSVSTHFELSNRQVLKWPKFHLYFVDGRNFLRTTQSKYDVIIAGTANPKSIGSYQGYFSLQGYTLFKDRLKKNGIFCQWIPLDRLRERDFQMILKTLQKTFPYSTLWLSQPFGEEGSVNAFLIASRNPLMIPLKKFEAEIQDLQMDFQNLGILSSLDLLDCFIAGENRMKPYVQNVPFLSDDHPDVDYSPVINDYNRILGSLSRLRENAWNRLRNVDESFREEIEKRFRITGFCIEGDLNKLKGNIIGALSSYQKANEMASSLQSESILGSANKMKEAIELEIVYLEGLKEETIDEVRLRNGSGSPLQVDEHLLFGYLQQKEGKQQEAILEYQKVLELEPNHLEARYNLALLYQKENQLEKAIQEYIKVLIKDPNHQYSMIGLGTAYDGLKKYDLAIQIFEEAQKLHPNNPLILYNLGEVFRKKKDYQNARKAWEDALKIDPNDAKVHSALGSLFATQSKFEAAEVEFLLALKTNPMDPETLGNLGILYARIGDRKSAIQMLIRALQIDPKNVRLRSNLEKLRMNP